MLAKLLFLVMRRSKLAGVVSAANRSQEKNLVDKGLLSDLGNPCLHRELEWRVDRQEVDEGVRIENYNENIQIINMARSLPQDYEKNYSPHS